MIDIKLLRENPDVFRDNIKKKFQDEKLVIVDQVLELDGKWKKEKQKGDELRKQRNVISEEINKAKKSKNDKKAKELIKEARELPDKIAKNEKKAKSLEEKRDYLLKQIPNLIWKDTPSGKTEKDNVEIKKWGKIPKFNFPVKNHVELAENLGIADFDSSAKVSGTGFYYLKKDLAFLNQALIRFGIDFMRSKGYEYIETPLILDEQKIYASMDRQAIEESVYMIKGEDKGLIGTAEQSLLAMHAGDTIPEKELPKKYFSYSMCFRQEIGAHGINEKGLWRTHQFNKVEQFIFCKPEDSEKLYDELMKNSEELLQALGIPYRIVEICTGDLADWKYRSADFEVWRPTTKSYGEIVSLSNCTDFQARKLDIKCISKNGERRVLHTLNDTAIATSRIMVAILENFQQADGSIKIPKALWPYMDGKTVIKKD